MSTGHSSIVGGSNADRLLACPGSYQANLALPKSADVSSEYALEGTAMHEVMAALMRLRQTTLNVNLYVAVGDMLGMVCGDRELTLEHLDTMVYPALDQLAALENEYGGGFNVVAIERHVDFPGIPGAHGTCDLILLSPTHILHVDWKFGQGVAVKARQVDPVPVYPDPAGDIINAQLLFYVAAAKASAPEFYKGRKKLAVAIIQPRADTQLTHTEISATDLRWFVEDMHNAVMLALDRDPPLKKGEHCRWCPAKISCPLWTSPMLDLTAMGDKVIPRVNSVGMADGYGIYLARAKALVDMAAMFKTDLDEQLHAYLEDGGKVPGWRLKAKVKQRQWVDPKIVVPALEKLGFESEEIFQTKLQTFARTDAAAKRLGVTIPNHLRVAPTTTETTVCRDDDPAPIVTRPLAIEQFRAALKALKKA